MGFYSRGGLSVLIESITSLGDSHGLYDYERKEKTNYSVSVDDNCDSYLLFVDNETGQLMIQPDVEDTFSDEIQNLEQGEKIKKNDVSKKIMEINKRLNPTIRLYLSKNSWYIEAMRGEKNILDKPLNCNSVSSNPTTQFNTEVGDSTGVCNSHSREKKYKQRDNRLWVVAPKTFPGIPLAKRDIIKLGRCKMLIHEIVHTSSTATDVCSKLPYLPLTRRDDLATDIDSFLRMTPSVNVVGNRYLIEEIRDDGDIQSNISHLMPGNDTFNDLSESTTKSILNSGLVNTKSFVGENKDEMPGNIKESNSLRKLSDFFDHEPKDDSAENRETGTENDPMWASQYRCNENKDSDIENKNSENNQNTQTKCCRICLSDDGDGFNSSNEPFNPLICPCDCKGSLEYVHLQCLRTWLESRIEIPSGWLLHTGRNNVFEGFNYGQLVRSPSVQSSTHYLQIRDRIKRKLVLILKRLASRISVSKNPVNTPACLQLKKFDCELCKVSFPMQLQVITAENSTMAMPLFRIPRPRFPYMVLVPIEGEHSSKMGQIIVSFGESNIPVCIGRGHNSDIRLGEISVSRAHAQFQHCFFNNSYNICLLDMKSKFGSLIELKRPLKLGKEGLSIQIGRALISFKTFRSNKSISNVIQSITSCAIQRKQKFPEEKNEWQTRMCKRSINLTVDSSINVNFVNTNFEGSARSVTNTSFVHTGGFEGYSSDQEDKQNQIREKQIDKTQSRHHYMFEP
ncbi:Ssm4 ring finger fused to a forkhead associated (FHA) domain (apicomplexan specific architecture) [Cryptosporidium bovis]|uniref:Ssm4 ring finger fused to a forkhead associated (FHA) domain (apicomplexan specific architecture) n=1 Tax=Cryptosporidium bovis TaxID=310047 RepID=UPI00351A95BE|nr:Ssm4 ring finger fused to a forkhead associated (FHA) domain (apicomplexan specific architecture) [Cryptosporidium bovis]